jgi:rhomboid-like protein
VRAIFTSSVITHYVDLPPNYRDDTGLPFRRRELQSQEVFEIFGPSTSVSAADKLLRILHGRRVAGTLDDPSLRLNTAQFTQAEQDTALKFLRKQVPVDEVTNAGLRAEDELKALNMDVVEGEEATDEANSKDPGYTSRLRLYKPEESKETKPAADSVYGQSVLEKLRDRNEARTREYLKRQAEEERKREEEAQHNLGPLDTIDGVRSRELSPRMQAYLDSATSDLQEPPEMPAWERLLPSTIFVMLLVGAAVAYARFYSPLEPQDRMFPDISPATATLAVLTCLNVAGYVLWKLPPAWGLMNRYFMLVAATPRPLSLLFATFSHQKFSHLLANMAFLWVIGTRLHDDVGRANFLATYFAAGSVGFLGTLYSLVLRNKLYLTSLGASGGIYGVAAAYFWIYRFDGFKFLGLPPDPANGVQGLGFIALMLALNIAAMRSSVLDVTSHIVGMAVGILAGDLLDKQMQLRKAQALQDKSKTTNLGFTAKVIEKK